MEYNRSRSQSPSSSDKSGNEAVMKDVLPRLMTGIMRLAAATGQEASREEAEQGISIFNPCGEQIGVIGVGYLTFPPSWTVKRVLECHTRLWIRHRQVWDEVTHSSVVGNDFVHTAAPTALITMSDPPRELGLDQYLFEGGSRPTAVCELPMSGECGRAAAQQT